MNESTCQVRSTWRGLWKADIKMLTMVTTGRWIPGNFYSHFCTLGFIWLDSVPGGRYHLPTPQHFPCLGDPRLPPSLTPTEFSQLCLQPQWAVY